MIRYNIASTNTFHSFVVQTDVIETHGVYLAEQQAIARSLAMCLALYHLHIHSDSRSSIEAIHAYESQLNERQRMCMSARPLVKLIHHLITHCLDFSGSVVFTRESARTLADTINIVSAIALLTFKQISISRVARREARAYPLSLAELPLDRLESHLHLVSHIDDKLQIINDVRRSALSVLRAAAVVHWSTKVKPNADQGRFAHESMIDLGTVTRRCGTSQQQSTLVHVATNTIHYRLVANRCRIACRCTRTRTTAMHGLPVQC